MVTTLAEISEGDAVYQQVALRKTRRSEWSEQQVRQGLENLLYRHGPSFKGIAFTAREVHRLRFVLWLYEQGERYWG